MIATGFAVGLADLTNLAFRPDRPYAGCRICGAVYQSDEDRDPHRFVSPPYFLSLEMVVQYALGKRKHWSLEHSKIHPLHEHDDLARSGNWATPEATKVLASYGIFSIMDGALSEEHAQALYESSPIPLYDSEG